LEKGVKILKTIFRNLMELRKKINLRALQMGGLFTALFVLAIFPVFTPGAKAREAEFLLLHANNVTGHLFPCPT
jgi:hypothetical protein